MRRLTGLVLMTAAASCWTGKGEQPEPVVGNRVEVAPEKDLTGAFWCTIGEPDYTYDRYPCVIKRVSGKQMLAKLSGSVRLRGFVKPSGRGFKFDGELYCPWGDCTEPLRGAFEPTDGGGYTSTLQGAVTVQLFPATNDEFGGVGYGGDGYGDPFGFSGNRGYGGGGYGGYGYGGMVRP